MTLSHIYQANKYLNNLKEDAQAMNISYAGIQIKAILAGIGLVYMKREGQQQIPDKAYFQQ